MIVVSLANIGRLRAEDEKDRGSVSVWMISTALTLMVLVGLAVDLGGQVLAKQRAQDIAVEAARTAGQQLQAPMAVLGQGAIVDASAAVAAGSAYIAGAPDMTGGVSVADGVVVIVDTTTTYNTKFLDLIGVRSLTVTGHAEVRIVRSVGGVAS
ncbi:membrane protein [Cellulomonas chitinilytica]|uniref:Membrane protein n=1 Tax=Cellulomonas chitinilytica TaxID=398759 RepID=A0A919P0U4_9CELL|nr:pilus assembly protein TadG-related protein [Cellulomonas chitinilytica]GIG21162.1 membrane protein [Cellulomonas chitinilytica]